MVTLATPLWPALNVMAKVTTGASKLIAAGLVPTSAPTVAVMASELPAPPDVLHCAVVNEVQDVVEQALAATATVAVASVYAKLRPEIVTTAAPDVGALAWRDAVTTGASNVKPATSDPARVATVRTGDGRGLVGVEAAAEHATLVAVVHDVVLQAAPAGKSTVAELSSGPKLRPVSVTETPPVGETLDGTEVVTTGESHVNDAVRVPTNPPTVSPTGP